MAIPAQIAEDWPTFRVPGADPWAKDLAVRLEGMRKEQAAAINEIIENLGGVATGGLEVGGVPGVGQVPKWAVGGAVWAEDEVGGVGGENDYVDAINASVAGSDVTLTLGRTGTLTDLATTFAVPASGGVIPPGYGVPTWEEPHLSNIVGAPEDGQHIAYEGSTGNLVFVTPPMGGGVDADNYVDAVNAVVSGSDVTLSLGRTGTLADLATTFTVPTGAGSGLPPGYGIPTWDEPHLSNIVGMPVDGHFVAYEGATGNLVFAEGTPPNGTGENDYVDTVAFAVVGQMVTMTLGRTDPLIDLAASFVIPTVTVPPAGLVVSGTPGVGQIPKWTGTAAAWADDEVGSAGSGEENVQSDLRVTDVGSDAFVLGKDTLFSGAYSDLTGVPAASENDYADTLNAVVVGATVTLTLGRTGTLADLVASFDVPVGGMGGSGFGIPTWEEPHLSNILGVPVDGQVVAYQASSDRLVFADAAMGGGDASIFKGTWSAGENYVRGDIVVEDDVLWQAEANPGPTDVPHLGPYGSWHKISNAMQVRGVAVTPGAWATGDIARAGTIWYLRTGVDTTTPPSSLATGWEAIAGEATGISQTDADARYLRLTGGDLSGDLEIRVAGDVRAFAVFAAEGVNKPTFQLRVNPTGPQKAFQASRDGEGLAWASFEGSLGGANSKPGIAFGPGTSGRDTVLYREGSNHLYTPDKFSADELAVVGDLVTTQGNLGIEPFARQTDASRVPTGKLGVGTASQTTVLYGDQTWRAVGAPFDWATDGNVDPVPVNKLGLADARYLRLTGGALSGALGITASGNVEALVVTATGATTQAVAHIFTGTSGAQKAFQAQRSGESNAWYSVDGALGGADGKPGIAFGSGTTDRDVKLFREASGHLRTSDRLTAESLAVTGPLSVTHTALGILPEPAIRALIFSWAQSNNTVERIPDFKLPGLISRALAEGGTDQAIRSWNALRVRQAVDAVGAGYANIDLQNIRADLDEAQKHTVRERIGVVNASEIDLTYDVGPGTLPDGRVVSYLGGVHQAAVDMTLLRARFRAQVPPSAGNIRDFSFYYQKVVQQNQAYLLLGNPIKGTLQIAPATGAADYHSDIQVGEGTHTIQARLGDGFEVGAGEHFALLVFNFTAGLNPRQSFVLGSMPPVTEDSHTGFGAFPFETIKWIGRAEWTSALLVNGNQILSTNPLFSGGHQAVAMEVDYKVAESGLLRVDQNGMEVYTGPPRVNFTGGATVTLDASGAVSVDIPNATVTADIRAQIADWAETGNTSDIPRDKLPDLLREIASFSFADNTRTLDLRMRHNDNRTVSATVVLPDWVTLAEARAQIANWARSLDGSEIPLVKIPNLNISKLPFLLESIDDRVAGLVQEGPNIHIVYDDANGVLNFSSPALNETQIVEQLLQAGDKISLTFNSGVLPHTLTIGTSAQDAAEVRANIANALQPGNNIASITHSVAAGTITINADTQGGGGGGGLTADQVRGLILDPAEEGNTERWPDSKIPTNVARLASPIFTGTPRTAYPPLSANDARIPSSLWVNQKIEQLKPSAQLLPIGGTFGQTLKKTSSANYAVAWQDEASAQGLSESEVRALVWDWAEQGNSERVPPGKLGSGTASASVALHGDGVWRALASGGLTEAQIRAFIWDWAEMENTATLPVLKLGAGTPSSNNYLRGDGIWAAVAAGGTGDDAFDWATEGNTSRIPIAKITGYPTGFSLVQTGDHVTGTISRQGLSAIVAGGFTVQGLPNSLTLNVAGQELTVVMGFTGARQPFTRSVTLPASGGTGGLSEEEVRDTIAAFAVAGDGVDIRHFDAANQLVFSARGVGDPFSTILALAFEGQVYYVDRFEPKTRSFLRGTIGGATALLVLRFMIRAPPTDSRGGTSSSSTLQIRQQVSRQVQCLPFDVWYSRSLPACE